MVERGGPTLDRAGSIHSVSLRNSARMSHAEGDDTLARLLLPDGNACHSLWWNFEDPKDLMRRLRII